MSHMSTEGAKTQMGITDVFRDAKSVTQKLDQKRSEISIHAPREGSDCKPAQNKRRNFSRMPCFTEKNEKRGQKACIGWKTKAKKAAKGKKTRCEGYEKSMTACGPHFAFIPSKAPRRRSRAVRRHVQFGCGSGRLGYKTAGCLPVCR